MKNAAYTPYSKIWIDDKGIMHSKYTKKTLVTEEVAIAEIQIIKEISQGNKVPLLVNMSNTTSITIKARKYYSGKESEKVIRAAALIVNSPLHSVMGNFFLGLNKPQFPVKLFSSEEQALKWLRKYICDYNEQGSN